MCEAVGWCVNDHAPVFDGDSLAADHMSEPETVGPFTVHAHADDDGTFVFVEADRLTPRDARHLAAAIERAAGLFGPAA